MTYRRKPRRRDRLNGWLVLVGCFLNQFIVDGLCYNYVNLFARIQTEFHVTSKLIASLPYMLLIGFYLLMAPVSLFLTKQYGTKRVAVVGSFLSTASLLVSSFLGDNLIAFSLFYGLLTGVGISLIYVPTVVATSKWFLKERLFANSLCVLSACVGAGVYPFLSELVLRRYSLFDTLLILAGVQLNCLVGSLLLRKHKASFLVSKLNSQRKPHSISRKYAAENGNGNCAEENGVGKSLNSKANKTKSISSAHLLENETRGKHTNVGAFFCSPLFGVEIYTLANTFINSISSLLF